MSFLNVISEEAKARALKPKRTRIAVKLPPLRSMSVDQLMTLRSEVDAALKEHVREERRRLEAELTRLSRIINPTGVISDDGEKFDGRKIVAPKYHHPDHPELTWSGRGKTPLWVKDALKKGHTMTSLIIQNGTR